MAEQSDTAATRGLNLIGALLGIVYLLWAMWTLMVPEPTRREYRLRIVLSCGQAMRVLGRRAGEASLTREASTGQANYELPYVLMWGSERLMDKYRGMTL
jgi:hypothetical protein